MILLLPSQRTIEGRQVLSSVEVTGHRHSAVTVPCAKRYVEENITIMSMIISSSHSYIYIYHIFFKFYTIAGFFFC